MNSNSKMSHKTIKLRNKKLVLNCIKSSSPTYRSTISRKLRLSKPTVSAIVEELIAEGWVIERPENTGDFKKVGRKPIQLIFNNTARYILGVDIGGTNVMVAISDLNGKIICERAFKTLDSINTGILSKLKEIMDEIIKSTKIDKDKVLGIGIGVPGIVNVEEGLVIDAPSLKWINYPLKEQAEKFFELPVYVDNDVNISVLGEQWLGSARDKENVLLISIGTGVGCGILLKGKLFRGSAWGAGEIGYMITDRNASKKKEISPISGYGFLDNQIGGPALMRKMRQEIVNTPEHRFNNNNDWETKDIFHLAMQGDCMANKVINDFIEHLSFALVNISSLLNPEIILLGGGLSKSGHWFLDRVKETVKQFAPYETEIELTSLDDKLGVTGAVSLFLEEHESIIKNE